MNERIKQLIRQAESTANEGIGFDGQEYTDILMEKFAELIVQKCADIGQQYADGNYEVYNQILEHFGIEE